MEITFQETSYKEEVDGVTTIKVEILLNGESLGFTESRCYNGNVQGQEACWLIAHTEIFKKRRQGYGKRLVEETYQRLRLKKPIKVILDALPQDPNITQKDLEKFYQSCGFVKSGIPKRMYRN